MVRLLEKDNRKNTLIGAFIFLFGAWLIAWLRLRNIDIMKGPYIFPDQLGYFTHAAIMSGLPWYQTTDSWYSYGISLVLAMIMRFTHNMASIYKIAIYVNVLLGELGYIFGIIFIKQIIPKLKNAQAFVISAVASCSTAYVFQAQVVWAETYVYTIFMLVLVLAAWYVTKPNLFRVILLAINVCLLFIVHNRTIVVIAALCLFVVGISVVDKKVLRQAVHLISVLVIVLGTFKANSTIKVWLQDKESFEFSAEEEWLNENSTIIMTTAMTRDIRPDMGGFNRDAYDIPPVHNLTGELDDNNLSGRLFNFSLMLKDPRAILGMLKSFLGSVWYLLTSTAGLAGFGLVYLVKKMLNIISKDMVLEEKVQNSVCVFLLLCVVATLIENGYNAMWYPQYMLKAMGNIQLEMLFYGRYVELLTMPLTILGIIDILQIVDKRYVLIECSVNSVLYVLTSAIVCIEMACVDDSTLNAVCVPGVYALLQNVIYIACAIPFVLGLLLYLVTKFSLQREGILSCVTCVFSVLMIMSFYYYNLKEIESYNNEAQISINGYDELAEVLHNNTDVLVEIDANTVIPERYYKLRTQAIDNEILFDKEAYWRIDGDMIIITGEDYVDTFIEEHPHYNLKVLNYGNYTILVRGDALQARLLSEGYELN